MKKFFMTIWNFIKQLFGCKCKCCENTCSNIETVELNPEHLIVMDKQDMYLNYSNNYRWYETCLKLKDFLDQENDGSLEEVVNVFQAIVEEGNGFDTRVHKFQHFNDGQYMHDSISGFWVEDFPLNDEAIKLSFKEAYEKLMATNCPKPHSRYVTLRKQVGPVDCNPQYIFGNLKTQVYVDAVTGKVSETNPAFDKSYEDKDPKIKYAFNWLAERMPLGEWP